tara:strand:- start:611 stop:895 length:285 start_codon:yes stop_codon:yes gene_type:complete
MEQVEVRRLRKGTYFKRKSKGKKVYVKDLFLRPNQWGAKAAFRCIDADDFRRLMPHHQRSICLRPETLVYPVMDFSKSMNGKIKVWTLGGEHNK